MGQQFVRTPFNADCPHWKLYFTTHAPRCPYCGAMNLKEARRRAWVTLILALAANAAIWFAIWCRGGL